ITGTPTPTNIAMGDGWWSGHRPPRSARCPSFPAISIRVFEKSPSRPDHALSKRMRTTPSDTKLTNLFLDMLAAEQGAGDNTLDAYRRDLTDFSEFLGRKGQNFTGAETQTLRDYLADLDTRGFKSSSVARRLSAMRHLLRFLLNDRIRSD